MKFRREIRRISKPELFSLIGYEIHHPEVARFHASSARIRIPNAPARTSKSFSTAADTLHDLFPASDSDVDEHGNVLMSWPKAYDHGHHLLCWIVVPNYKLAKEFQYLYEWIFLQYERRPWPFDFKRKPTNKPKSGDMEIQLTFGPDRDGIEVTATVEVRSAENEKSLQADEVHRLVMGEAAEIPAFVWEKYLESRYGRAVMPTTPKAHGEWLKKLSDEGEENPDLLIETFAYDGRCNPT